MKVDAIKTKIFREDEDLAAFVVRHIPKMKNGAILVITSKIVSLSEGRVAPLAEKRTLIWRESEAALRTKKVWFTIRGNLVLPNAGIDESNAKGKLTLLPRDSFRSARRLRMTLMKRYGIRMLGVIIIDSVVLPKRAGVVGVALGYAGVRGLKDYRKKKDLYGRRFNFSRVNVVDSIASAAALTMGEGSERQPLAVIEGAPVEFVDRVNKNELSVKMSDDMYAPLLKKLKRW